MPSLSEGEFFGLGISIAIITIIGFAMQVLSLLILCKKQFRKCDLTPYFLNIAVANTIVIVVDLPPVAASAFANKKLMGDIYCQMLGFFTGVGCITTFATMGMSLFKIYRRLRGQTADFEMVLAEQEDLKPHKILKTLTVSWFYGSVVMFPPLVGWGSFASESGGAICAPNWRDSTASGRSYLLVLVFLAFAVPLGVSIACFVRIYKRSRQTPDDNLMTARERAKARKVAMKVLFGMVSFAVSWTPYCVCAMISVLGGSDLLDRDKSFIPGIFAKASTVYNPMICLLISKRFRSVAADMLCCYKRDDHISNEFIQSLAAMTKRTPDAEVSGERFIDTYQPKSCLVQTPVLMENMLNTSGPKETSV